ncbi:MAG: hypothetical protein OJF58_002909 [Enhydrobacter sp.]|jgi:hypothetical protein|nr:MAG: hypothetical protein OJF58_002909 [Enhydrobacter sp.]
METWVTDRMAGIPLLFHLLPSGCVCMESSKGYCRIEGGCVVRSALCNATSAFLATLDGHTLADLVRPKRTLGRLLALDPGHTSRGRSGTAR